MKKVSIARFFKVLITVLSFSFFLYSCTDGNNVTSDNSDKEDNTEQTQTGENTEKTQNEEVVVTPKMLYQEILGTWVNITDDTDTITISDSYILKPTHPINTPADYYSGGVYLPAGYINDQDRYNISDDYLITLESLYNDYVSSKKGFGRTTYMEENLSQKDVLNSIITSTNIFDNNDLCIHTGWTKAAQVFAEDYTGDDNIWIYVSLYILKKIDDKLYVIYSDLVNSTDTYSVYTKAESSNNDYSSSYIQDDELKGTYSIEGARESARFKMESGIWTFEYASSSKSGTYSITENDITINYSIGGQSCSAVFTISKTSSGLSLTVKSGDYTTIISSVFMITIQDVLEGNSPVVLEKK